MNPEIKTALDWRNLLAILACLISPSMLMSQQFQNPAYYKAGKNSHAQPNEVVAADVNNDGHSDLIVADYFEDQIRVLINKGDGTFEPGKNFAVPGPPVALAAADLNNDGRLDLLVVISHGSGDGTLGVYLGNGNGTFGKGTSYTLGPFVGAIGVADFNNDGNVDAAVPFTEFNKPSGVMVFFGDGKGKLKKNATYKLPGELGGLAAADLKGDGYPDLVVAEYQNESVAILINQHDGKFGKPVTYSTFGPSAASNVAIADLNHDGIPDLAVATVAPEAGLNIFLGVGHGKFKPGSFYGDFNPIQLAIADFNLDGNLDVIGANNTGAADVFYGNGDGTFLSAFSIGTKYKCGYSVTTDDFDHDGAADVAFSLYNINKVAVLLNKE